MTVASLTSHEAIYLTARQSRSDARRERLGRLTRWLAVAVGFTIPLSTSVCEIVTGLFVLCCLISEWPRLAGCLRGGGGVPAAAATLFGALALGTLWSSAGFEDGVRCLLKYREFLYLPLLALVFAEPKWRTPAIYSFVAGCLTLLGLSYFEWAANFDMGIEHFKCPTDSVVTKDRIIHGLLMSLSCFLCVLEFQRNTGWKRWLAVGVIAATLPNILFLVSGRTGYLALSALTLVLFTHRMGRRGFAIATITLGLGGMLAYLASPLVRDRVAQTVSQINNQFGPERKKSLDPRLEFYTNTLTLLRRHPWTGTGTGSFRKEYAALVAGTDMVAVSEPHSEFLLLSAQLGIGGGLAFLLLLALQWRSAGKMPLWERQVLRGV
ncbi:MAG: O-antigen ligase domain-containing protein, partial [Planctomycetaceae bacterium]